MHFFAAHKLERELYKNSFDFTNYSKDLEKLGIKISEEDIEQRKQPSYLSNYYYNINHEYVVVWYAEQIVTHSNSDDTVIYVDVLLANLTQPTYPIYDSSQGKNIEYDSYITVQIPINYLHKMPYGSIWKAGKSSEIFVLDTFEIQVKDDNYQIYSIVQALRTQYLHGRDKDTDKPFDNIVYPTPFNFKKYFNKISPQDRNQLINIKYNDKNFVIHPFQLFITHYGYSMDIKRIIARYSINEIEKRLIPNDKNINNLAEEKGQKKFVILPRNFTQRDSVFLYHYKYDEKLRAMVKNINNRIQLNKTDNKQVIKIDFWYKPTQLKLRGICIDGTVLCTSIIGISEHQGDPINVFLQPKKNVNFDTDEYRKFSVMTPYTPPKNIEDLDFLRSPVNNIIQGILREKLEKLGALRELNVIKSEIDINPVGDNTQFINYPKAQELSIGDKQGSIGNTGYANCFFDVETHDDITSRFSIVWQDAKDYATEIGSTVEWFTFKKGFNSDDNYYVMSLANFHIPEYDLEFPKNVLVIRIQNQENTYFILEFGEDLVNSQLKGYTALVYEQGKGEDFINSKEGLSNLLLQVVGQGGTIDTDFIDCYRGKISTFVHRTGKNNNWVKNGIKKLS